MQFSQVNEQALIKAAETIVGPQATAAVMQLYQIIDRAMFDGYQLGVAEATKNVEQAINAAFDEGWKHGEAEAEGTKSFDIEEAQGQGWDQGYLTGVADARARPAWADQIVIDILSDAAENAFNDEFDADNVQDSGDEDVPTLSALR